MASKVTPLNKEPKAPPPLQVVSVENSNLFLARQFERYNPDTLAARKGGLGIYARMMQDEQVKAVVNFKDLSVVGRGYTFAFDKRTKLPREEQQKRLAVMQAIPQRMKGSFMDALIGTLRARRFGFSLQEIVTDTIEVDGASYIGINKILPRDVTGFTFYTDDTGELKRFVQKVTSREIELDLNKFIHYVQNPDEDVYYGQSELRAAYRSWFMKDTILKFWTLYLERFAGGFMAISLGESGLRPDSPDYLAMQNVLSNMRSAMGIILPAGVTAEMVTPATTDAYEKAVNFHDLAIAKALLIPNLLGLSNSGQTGAYAQSQTQLEAYFMTIAADTARLEDTLNDQLFAPLARQNWDDGEFPRFQLKKASAEFVKWVVTSWKDMVGANAVVTTEADEAHLRDLLEMPVRSEDDEPLVTPQQEQAQKDAEIARQDAAANAEASRAHELAMVSAKATKPEPKAEAFTAPAPAPVVVPAQESAPTTKFSIDAALQRVDFAYMAQRALAIESDTSEQLAVAGAKALAELLTTEKLASFVADPQTIGQAEIDRVSIGKLKAIFRSALERGWSTGLNQAMSETAKALKQLMSADDRKLHFKSLRDNASDFFDSSSFRMAGNLTDGMRAIIQQELQNAVKSGRRPDEVASQIYERLIRKGFTTLDAVKGADTREEVIQLLTQLLQDALSTSNIPAYLNTLTRTNTFEAMNEARFAEFTNPALGDFVVALRYSAILDDRTTDICQELHGHVHAKDSEVWDEYRPPNHFNCRSVLYAVTKLDGWDGVESPAPTVEIPEGFK